MFSSSECITWLAAFLTESVAIVTVNFISIILFIKNRNLRIRAMYLVINLTVADTLVAVICSFQLLQLQTIGCDIMNMSSRLTWEGNIITSFLSYWFLLTSLTNIAVISLDRMHATFRPFRHRVIEKRVYGVTVAGVWLLAGMISTAISIVNHFGEEWSHHFYVWQSYTCSCLFAIFVSYPSIIVKFLCGVHPQQHGAASRQRKLTMTLFIMTIVSLLMWLPYTIFVFVYFTTGSMKFLSDLEINRLEYSLKILFFTNSLVNPIVYTIRMPEFRKALLVLFKRRQRQNAPMVLLHAR